MIKINGRRQPPRKQVLEIKNFAGGSNLLLAESRIAPNEIQTCLNVMQVEDGLLTPRWGNDYYGADYETTIDGASEFVKPDGSTELIVIANGKAYKSTDGGTKTELSGATFTTGKQAYFMQIAGFLYIANGVDPLTRYNGTTLDRYTKLDTPTGLTASNAGGLATGAYPYYAEVTALNEVGETVGSTEATTTVSKQRDTWTSGQGIKWSWTAVSGADRYQIYISEQTATEYLVGNSVTNSFLDDGTNDINSYVIPPLSDTTSAPKFKSMVVSGNRIWATNDSTSPYIVYFSGTGQFIGNFSDFFGGGWINLERGGRERPVKIIHYQSGQGEGRATVLCKTPEGRGAIWQLSIATATVGATSFSLPSAVKVIGSSGTESISGVVATNNEVMFPNRRGWFSLGPQQNFYGILRTNEISAKIRPYWNSIIGTQLEGIASYFKDGKVLISVPTNTGGNNRTIILDTERNNWTVDWNIGAKQFLEYTETSGKTRFIYVPSVGTKLVEMGENVPGDLGNPIFTKYVSGRIPLGKIWKEFVRISRVYIKIGKPKGTVNFTIMGTEKKGVSHTLATKMIVANNGGSTGIGWDRMGDCLMGDTNGTLTFLADSADIRYLTINKNLRDITIEISSNSFNADYTLQGFIIEGLPLELRSPTSWKLV